MTALWFERARPPRTGSRSSRTPRPVLHAINYLLGDLDAAYLTTLRRVRRPAELPEPAQGPGPGRLLHRLGRHRRHRADLGRAGPPLRRRRSSATAAPAGSTRLLGDAELDEGAVWEAVARPVGRPSWARSSGSSTSTGSRWTGWSRTSARARLQGMFAAAGWQVLTVKYGRLLRGAVRPAGRRGAARPDRRDAQRGVPAAAALPTRPSCGPRCPATARTPPAICASCSPSVPDDATLPAAIRNLGGHDLGALRDGFAAIDDTRPTVIFAYTVKGYGLADRGPPAEPLRAADRRPDARARRRGSGLDPTDPWAPFPAGSAPRPALCAETAARLRRDAGAHGRTARGAGRPRPHPAPAPPPPRPRSAARCST